MAVVELGDGPPVVALGAGFADSEAHRLLARRFRVIVLDCDGDAAARWVAEAGLETVGFLGLGEGAAVALAAADAAGERTRCIVLASPGAIPSEPSASRAPKAVLIGTTDASQPRDAVSLWRRALPPCNVVLVYGAGADVAGDRPQAFADAAGDFLDRQGRFGFATESVAVLPA
jgi:pimeloyl-ACP methyl ester carboxylesterase